MERVPQQKFAANMDSQLQRKPKDAVMEENMNLTTHHTSFAMQRLMKKRLTQIAGPYFNACKIRMTRERAAELKKKQQLLFERG